MQSVITHFDLNNGAVKVPQTKTITWILPEDSFSITTSTFSANCETFFSKGGTKVFQFSPVQTRLTETHIIGNKLWRGGIAAIRGHSFYQFIAIAARRVNPNQMMLAQGHLGYFPHGNPTTHTVSSWITFLEYEVPILKSTL